MEAVGKAFPPGEPIAGKGAGLDDVSSTITVVEAVLPIDDEDQGTLSSAFDGGIECIRMLQLGYARVSSEPITQISRLQVPFAVPLAVREYRLDERRPNWPGAEQLQIFLTNAHDNFLKGKTISDQVEPYDFGEVLDTVRVAHEGPFARTHQMMEKAASFADHDNVVGGVLLGTAIEMLVLDLSVSLLWEQGLDPSEASSRVLTRNYRSQPTERLLQNVIRKALGEAWTQVDSDSVSRCLSDIMRLRNRTVHQGKEATDDEIRQAFQASREFVTHIELALLEHVEYYPLTAVTLISREQIESSGRVLELEDVLEETPRPLDNWNALSAYRFEVMRPNNRIGLNESDDLCGNVDASNVAMLIHPDGKERWWLVDEEASLACPAVVPTLSRRQRGALRRVRREATEFSIEGYGASACRLDGTDSTPMNDPPTWYRLGDIWPMRRWDRYPAWPLPHPLVFDE